MLDISDLVLVRAFDMRKFFRFSFISGGGWIFDFTTYLTLTALTFSPGSSNFVSSFVGVTFVWFASLNSVFNRDAGRHRYFLFIYWGYQFLSILAYSKLLQMVFLSIGEYKYLGLILSSAVVAKIAVTPLNLVTNYLFMRLLSIFIPRGR
jgi:hypothetical protein